MWQTDSVMLDHTGAYIDRGFEEILPRQMESAPYHKGIEVDMDARFHG